jgi:hypothetical protein
MLLKIVSKNDGARKGTINFEFSQLESGLNLINNDATVWILDGAVITWPEELLNSELEAESSDCKIFNNGDTVICRSKIFRSLSKAMFGDWTRIFAIESLAADLSDIDYKKVMELDQPILECVDAAFWVLSPSGGDQEKSLRESGFIIEIIPEKYW